jgi:hypothetical protein
MNARMNKPATRMLKNDMDQYLSTPTQHARGLKPDAAIDAFFALFGLVGSVFLFRTRMAPPILVSFYLALGVSSLVYRFLGGIGSAKFTLGPLRVGGTMAALLGVTLYVNWYLASQTLSIMSPEGQYEWQYSGDGWEGYIEVKSDKSAHIDMQKYIMCGGKQEKMALLQEDKAGRVEESIDHTQLRVEIPVHFIDYDSNCKGTTEQYVTILKGSLNRTSAFLGGIEYQKPDSAHIGGMILVKNNGVIM